MNRYRVRGERGYTAWRIILAVIACLAAACGAPPEAPATATFTAVSPTLTDTRKALASPTFSHPGLAPTANMAATPAASMPCSEAERSEYLASVDPLAHDMLTSARQAELLAANNTGQVREGQAEARRLLAAVQLVQAPACAATTHALFVEGFSGLAAAWDLLAAKDTDGARDRLEKSYEQVVEAIVRLSGIEP